MAASYKKLFKLLIDRDMKKKELAEKAGISIATITKMGKDGAVVSSEVLVKISTTKVWTFLKSTRFYSCVQQNL